MVQKRAARSRFEHRLGRLPAQHRSAHQSASVEARDRSEKSAICPDCSWRRLQAERDSLMLWWVGSGLILAWLILRFVKPMGWIPMLLISGVCVLIIQLAAYRKTKSVK